MVGMSEKHGVWEEKELPLRPTGFRHNSCAQLNAKIGFSLGLESGLRGSLLARCQ